MAIPEIGNRGVVCLVQEVYLQATIDFQLVRIFLFEPSYFRQVFVHVLLGHIPKCLERKWRMRGEAISPETIPDGEFHKIFRETTSIAKIAMAMIVTVLHR